MDKSECTKSSREIYSGKIVKLRIDEVELANGHVTKREVVEHAPAAVSYTHLDVYKRQAMMCPDVAIEVYRIES